MAESKPLDSRAPSVYLERRSGPTPDEERSRTRGAHDFRFEPPEELIWHRLFISERHRFDGADILHLMLKQADALDWRRLVDRVGEHWPLLLAYVSFFTYVYPEHAHLVPAWVAAELLGRL